MNDWTLVDESNDLQISMSTSRVPCVGEAVIYVIDDCEDLAPRTMHCKVLRVEWNMVRDNNCSYSSRTCWVYVTEVED